MIRRLTVFIALAFQLTASAAVAGDHADLDRGLRTVWDHTRSALFYLRTGNPAVASIELDEGVRIFAGLEERFGVEAPEPYGATENLPKTMKTIGATLREAGAERPRRRMWRKPEARSPPWMTT